MTRSEQKAREIRLVRYLFEVLGQRVEVVETAEPPDVVVSASGSRIGIEVTEYHDPSITEAGVPRRVVEAWWQRIRKEAVARRKGNDFLDGLHVYLRFHRVEVPGPREASNFVESVATLLDRNRALISNEWIELNTEADERVRQYVRTVRVKRADGYWAEWDWNHDVGRVGVTENDLLTALNRKLTSASVPGISELWLLVSDGVNLSQIVAAFSAERLSSFARLEDALQASPYVRVFLLDFEIYEWAREAGWRLLRNRRS
jgi:hypothetical protein